MTLIPRLQETTEGIPSPSAGISRELRLSLPSHEGDPAASVEEQHSATAQVWRLPLTPLGSTSSAGSPAPRPRLRPTTGPVGEAQTNKYSRHLRQTAAVRRDREDICLRAHPAATHNTSTGQWREQ